MQDKHKTRQILSGYDNLGLGKTNQGKERQSQIVYQALIKSERQLEGKVWQSLCQKDKHYKRQDNWRLSCTPSCIRQDKTNRLSCWKCVSRQDKTNRLSCRLTHAFGKTIFKDCLAHHWNESARQLEIVLLIQSRLMQTMKNCLGSMMNPLGKTIQNCLAEVIFVIK